MYSTTYCAPIDYCELSNNLLISRNNQLYFRPYDQYHFFLEVILNLNYSIVELKFARIHHKIGILSLLKLINLNAISKRCALFTMHWNHHAFWTLAGVGFIIITTVLFYGIDCKIDVAANIPYFLLIYWMLETLIFIYECEECAHFFTSNFINIRH